MKAEALEALFANSGEPGLGPESRAGVKPLEVVGDEVERWCGARRLGGARAVCLKALAWVWHDHLDPAHGLVQDLSGADAAWIHGIIHRREPDYSNARYWFHRVGNHPILEALADEAAPVLASHAALPFRLIREGRWDAFAFIDAVSACSRHDAESVQAELLRSLQAIEVRVLARHLAGD